MSALFAGRALNSEDEAAGPQDIKVRILRSPQRRALETVNCPRGQWVSPTTGARDGQLSPGTVGAPTTGARVGQLSPGTVGLPNERRSRWSTVPGTVGRPNDWRSRWSTVPGDSGSPQSEREPRQDESVRFARAAAALSTASVPPERPTCSDF